MGLGLEGKDRALCSTIYLFLFLLRLQMHAFFLTVLEALCCRCPRIFDSAVGLLLIYNPPTVLLLTDSLRPPHKPVCIFPSLRTCLGRHNSFVL